MTSADELLSQAWQQHLSGKIPQAERMYRQVLADFPSHAAAWTFLGMACFDQLRFDEAVAAYQQSLALDPNLAQTYQNLGKCRPPATIGMKQLPASTGLFSFLPILI